MNICEARQLIVAPASRARFRIRSDIRCIHLSGEALEDVHVLPRAQRLRQYGRVVRCPIVLCMATHAVSYVPDQVLAPRQACRRALELPRRERARPFLRAEQASGHGGA